MWKEEFTKEFGHEVAKSHEDTWKKRGYKVNSNTGLLEQLNGKTKGNAKSQALKKAKVGFYKRGEHGSLQK